LLANILLFVLLVWKKLTLQLVGMLEQFFALKIFHAFVLSIIIVLIIVIKMAFVLTINVSVNKDIVEMVVNAKLVKL